MVKVCTKARKMWRSSGKGFASCGSGVSDQQFTLFAFPSQYYSVGNTML